MSFTRLPSLRSWVAFINQRTSKNSWIMVVRLVELGPFGCRIDRGTVEDLQDIPEGYETRSVIVDLDSVTVFIEPATLKTIRNFE